MSFISLPIETNAGQIEQDAYDLIQSHFLDWEPADGELAVWLIRWKSIFGADLAELIVDVADEVFYRFGTEVHQVTPIAAAPATVTSTWTAVDDAGYTIPAGTEVGIRTTGDTLNAFRVLSDVTIDPGDTATAAGEVVLQAAVEGTEGNETGDVELIDALTWVDSIALVGTPSGGVDAETPDEYLDRLVEELGLLSRLIILPGDAEVVARRIAGVERALALDLYAPTADYRPPGNPAGNGLYDNEKTITVAVVDEDGVALSNTVKDALVDELALRRETGFVFYVIDPTYTEVAVDIEVVALTGYASADVEASVEAALAAYLDPTNWGRAVTDTSTTAWTEQGTVYINEIIALVDKVTGVDRVVSVEIAEEGDPTAATDLPLNGPASLTQAGTITATVS